MLPNIHILGIQGSGKGTQSALLVEKFSFSYISSGELFRKRAAQGDAFGEELKAELTAGRLLEDRHLFQAIEDYLATTTITKGFLGDGVIRTTNQYHGLQKMWELHDLEQPLLIHLILSEEKAMQRIAHRQAELAKIGTAKREDDTPEGIRQRFVHFHTLTEPVIQLFEEAGRCIHIDADQSVEEIHVQISTALRSLYPGLT